MKPVRIPDEMGEESVPGSNPTEHIEVVLKRGDTDEEWAAKMADYNAAIAPWHAAVIQDNANMDVFDAALEVERQKVDRIAIAGRVPVNVLGAADMISMVIRASFVQLETPDEMRGRVSAVNGLFIGASNQLGEFESGASAHWLGTVPAVVLGGVGTLVVTGLWIKLFPGLANRDRMVEEKP